jgi:ribosomal-protein-alanine N-acetyltransferase
MFRNWASDPEVVRFMPYDVCNSLEETQKRIIEWMRYFEETAPNYAVFAIILKDSGEVIGTIDFAETDREAHAAEVGYQLGKEWWGHGYAAEALRAVIQHCFETVKLNRLWASYDPRNPNSGRVLEKAGMVYEGTLRQCKIRRGELADSVRYAILAEDWEIMNEIAYFKTLPCIFDDFIEVPELTDGVIYLVCTQKRPAIPEKKYVPAYDFAICKGGEKVGEINLRIGYSGFGPDESSLYYGGQIGYNIDEQCRGNGYAGRACRLLLPVAKAHHMTKLLITNHIQNKASKRVCEKLGLRFLRTVRIPEWHDLYKSGQRFQNIYEWDIV